MGITHRRAAKGSPAGGQFIASPSASMPTNAQPLMPTPSRQSEDQAVAELIADVASDANGWDWFVAPASGDGEHGAGALRSWKVDYIDDYGHLEDPDWNGIVPQSSTKHLCVVTEPPPGRDPVASSDEWLRDLAGFLDRGQIKTLAAAIRRPG